MKKIVQVPGILYRNRIIEPIFILNLLQYLLRYISLLRRAERSSGNHMHEEKSESYQNKQGENPCKETFDYVLYHTRTYLMY